MDHQLRELARFPYVLAGFLQKLYVVLGILVRYDRPVVTLGHRMVLHSRAYVVRRRRRRCLKNCLN